MPGGLYNSSTRARDGIPTQNYFYFNEFTEVGSATPAMGLSIPPGSYGLFLNPLKPVMTRPIVIRPGVTTYFTLSDSDFHVATPNSKLTTLAMGPGKVDINKQGVRVAAAPLEAISTLLAVPDPGYRFLGWTGDVTTTVNPISLFLGADINIQAIFGLNTAPIADGANPAPLAVIPGSSVELSLLAHDAENDTLAYAIVLPPAHGTLANFGAPNLFTYTPADGFTGADNFSFKVNDGAIDSTVVSVGLTVGLSLNPPVAQDQTLRVPSTSPVSDVLQAIDPDLGTLTYSIVSGPAQGTVTLNSAATGAFTYTPGATVPAADTFTFKASNGTKTSNVATVRINPRPEIISSLIMAAAVDHPFTYTLFATNNPKQYAISNLPAGLTSNSNVISGISTAKGTFNVNVSASNVAGADSKTLVLTVVDLPVITSALAVSGTVGVPFNYSVTATGTTPITFTASGLPAGLVMNGSTISGTPAIAGKTVVILGGNNSAGYVAVNPTITIDNASGPPTLESIKPTSAASGGTAFTLTLTGTNFVGTSVVNWNGALRPTTVVSATQLTAMIPATDIATAGTASVTVVNPAPGGGTSSAQAFTIIMTNPIPTLASISPTSAVVGGATFTLTLTGTNFVGTSVVNWNGASRPTTVVSATQLTAMIPATDIATAGIASVTGVNPAPGGGTSSAQTFTIIMTNPTPTLASINPASIAAGNATFTMSLTGTNFVNGSIANWNGAPRLTTFVSSTQLTAEIPAGDVATEGTASVSVFTPAPGGGTSAAQTFTIYPYLDPLPNYIERYTFTTFAGPYLNTGSVDGTGATARFISPEGVAIDSSGNLYVADTANSTIRKITPSGEVSTLAGLAGVSGRVDGTGENARFNKPRCLAVDSGGNVFVGDWGNVAIRKITPGGVVTTFAIVVLSSGDFLSIYGIAVDSSGNVYVADAYNHIIGKVTPAGVTTTFAGKYHFSGRFDGTGTNAHFDRPTGIAVDSNNNVYVTDSENCTIRKITPDGVVTTLAGFWQFSGTEDGIGNAARFLRPLGITVDANDNLFVTDCIFGLGTAHIRRITPAGVVTTMNLDNPYALSFPSFGLGMTVDTGGNLYVADTRHNEICKITPSGVATTLAGLAPHTGYADGTGAAARFNSPGGVALDSFGNLYVADSNNNRIRKIMPGGVVTTFAVIPAHFAGSINSVAVDRGGNVYTNNSDDCTIRKISPAGVMTTLACPEADIEYIEYPYGVAVDSSSNVYVSDAGSHTIRKITPDGIGTTLAGTWNVTGSADGTGSAAQFNDPAGLAVDSNNNVYVADAGNYTIRKVTPDGVVTTLAGMAGVAGGADGTGASARFNSPGGVTLDSFGNLYVADDTTIRRITPGGVVTTLAGTAGVGGGADGTGATAQFLGASGVAVASNGNIYVADSGNNSIRVGKIALPDVATIDNATGLIGALRQLGTSPDTATSWSWNLIRQPSGSAAKLSSTTIQNPTFVPDVADLYVFQLTAIGSTSTSITTISLDALASYPVPTLSLITPYNIIAEGAPFTLTATGTNFVPASVVQINGSARATTFISSTSLTAEITADDIAVGGKALITVMTPAPGGGTTIAILLTIVPLNPAPTLSSISPSAVALGGADFTLTATGNDFVYASVVQINGSARATTFISSTSLTAEITADDIAAAGTVNITVTTTGPGGGTSAARPLTIVLDLGTGGGTLEWTSYPTSFPNPSNVGQTVAFTAAATDSNDGVPGYTWDFGDGFKGFGANVTHAYTTADLYTIKVVANNGNPNSTLTYSFTQAVNSPGAVRGQLSVTKASITFNFKSPGKSDSLVLSGTVPILAGFMPSGVEVDVNIGNIPTQVYMLTSKGSDMSNKSSTLKLAGKLSKGVFAGTSGKFTVTLKKQDLFTGLKDYGFANDTVARPGVSVTVPIAISVKGNGFATQVDFIYKASKGKTGKAATSTLNGRSKINPAESVLRRRIL